MIIHSFIQYLLAAHSRIGYLSSVCLFVVCVSLYAPGWPGTHYGTQASALQRPRLQVCATMLVSIFSVLFLQGSLPTPVLTIVCHHRLALTIVKLHKH